MKWVLPLALLIVIEAVADILAKEWSVHGSILRWVGAIGAYILANIFWLVALKDGADLGRGAIIFSVASAVLAILIGVVLYKETVTRIQLLGMLLGLLSLVLIFWD
jgi:multidrug transporter EmrE-like cation transporter